MRSDLELDDWIDQAIPALYFLYNRAPLSFPPLTWKCGSIDEEVEPHGYTVANALAIKPLARPWASVSPRLIRSRHPYASHHTKG